MDLKTPLMHSLFLFEITLDKSKGCGKIFSMPSLHKIYYRKLASKGKLRRFCL